MSMASRPSSFEQSLAGREGRGEREASESAARCRVSVRVGRTTIRVGILEDFAMAYPAASASIERCPRRHAA